ncbi:arginine--tRNA ligase [Aureliella helgolandensis]|uniref:Arginine--tRNA ligase n=1 Tax=Aureliella helgolandensis TaxID=2527968 RepID=A0A518G631_9BACT|nr:arginine--tRNA ligase [Aureliella helgolandensis]QDV24029.1 Arginine--tRNA ligase [Aureliella helgolandensis]
MQILSLLRSRFEQALDGWVADPASHAARVAVARDPRNGDYQANIAMPLAKPLGMKPQDVAAEVVRRLQIDDLCEPPTIAGPGFINLKLKDAYLASQLAEQAADSRCGVSRVAAPRRYVLDYSAPNVAKPMHVGHIRSTVIGDALNRTLRFLGHHVVSDNHLGDWGTQFGMIIYGYQHFADQPSFAQDPVAELSRLYRLVQQIIGYQSSIPKLAAAQAAVEAAQARLAAAVALPADNKDRKKQIKSAEKEIRNCQDTLAGLNAKIEPVAQSTELMQLATEHAGLETRAQLETVKLHEGNPDSIALWQKFLPLSITEIESVYERLDVHFDHTYGESFYHPMLAGTVQKLVDSGMAVESDGATCIFLEGFEAPMIIRKRDGAFLYATTDLATIDYRLEHFQPDAILYVVDHRQGEHFQKLFAAARACGHEATEFQHISFGTVLGTDGKPFKTRSGSVIGLDYLLDEAVERAHQAVCNPDRLQKAGLDMSADERLQVANVVGLGAIKFADLSHNRTSDYEFNTEKMVQLEGNTSAYIQYMYARLQSILRKSGVDVNQDTIADFTIELQEPAERSLALQLLQFEDMLHLTVEEYYPSVLAGYLYGVAKQFASFFDQCPVLIAETDAIRKSRLAVCHATGQVLRQGLDLLGIGVVDRM